MTRISRSDKRTQSVEKPRAKRPHNSPPAARGEGQSQFTLQMRESLHRELAREAIAIRIDESPAPLLAVHVKSKSKYTGFFQIHQKFFC